jgi:hypothetical protein
MRKLLITAAAVTAMFAATGANAMPGSSNGIAADSPVTNVALCFYLDGWNGPGMYDCGFRYNRGHGWHGKRHDGGHHGSHSGKHHSGKSGKSHKSGKKHH